MAENGSTRQSAATRYRIDEINFAVRRQLLGFDEHDVRTLAKLTPWMQRNVRSIIKDFYDRQFKADDSREFLEALPPGRVAILRGCESISRACSNVTCWASSEEAEGGGTYGLDYFSKRLHVGRIHNEINLPVKLASGALGAIADVLHSRLLKKYVRASASRKALHAVSVVLNYEMQAIVDAFILDYFEFSGVRLERLAPQSDLGDAIAQHDGN